MLAPANRLTLIEAMRPPPGFWVESAMAVTFTLDLRALLAAPAAFALASSSVGEVGSEQFEPVELLHALRSHADRITVFSQAGHIALPPSRRVFAFLEGAVVPVDAPRGGIVHPKVWVLRYERDDPSPGGEDRRLRVLVASRNLTFDSSWDTLLRLDERPDDAGARLESVGELFVGLLGCAVGPVGDAHERRVGSLSAALRAATFALPEGVEDLRAHVLGIGRPGSPPAGSPLPHGSDRSLVISPFVSDRFFSTVHPRPIDELVSRQESLDSLSPGSLALVDRSFTFDDRGADDLSVPDEGLSQEDPGRPLSDLHAKIFAFEDGGGVCLFVGSANATWQAFNSNVEILIELRGSVESLGIDRLCSGAEDELSLRDLFIPFRRSDEAEPSPEDSALDEARRAVARLPVEGAVEPSGEGWSVRYRTSEPLPTLDGLTAECWPLASSGNRRSIAGGVPLDARFETSLESLSGFLAFRINGDGLKTEFVVPVTLTDVPADRERALLRALIGNAERFLRYLLAMLDDGSDHLGLRAAVDRAAGEGSESAERAVALPVLERLLRTMRRDPARLAALHPLVTGLAADDALPDGFSELWEAIVMVTEAAESQGSQRR